MRKNASKVVLNELRRIAKDNGGVLIPSVVVDAARAPNSPLHSKFTWDDDEAADQYRLWQARQLIRTTVKLIKINNGDPVPVRVFVSLTPDRKEESGGYREVRTVLTNKDMRAQMLADAIEEMRLFEQKYASLKQLAKVFAAMRSVRNELSA